MNYLHGLSPVVIHRGNILADVFFFFFFFDKLLLDLKSSNILVDKSFNLKVCDFGVARFFEDQEQYLKTFCSTLSWTAPEISIFLNYKH